MTRSSTAAEQLERFAAGLDLEADGTPPGLFSGQGEGLATRFGIYRNNMRESLIGALAVRHPVTERLVGRPFFAALAEAFIARHPPRSPVLMQWGNALASFTEGFEPAASLPFLPDMIRLEAAMTQSYHAADASPLAPEAFAQLAPDVLADLRFSPHPALGLLRSRYPVATLWEAHQGPNAPEPLRDWNAEDILITRPAMKVEVRRLPEGCAAFVDCLAAGRPVAKAVDAALADAEAFDLATAFAIIIQSGSFSACQLPGERHA